MNRRRFLTAGSAAIGASLTGCVSTGGPDPTIESISSESVTLNVQVGHPEQADEVVFEPEQGLEQQSATVSKESPTASFELGEPSAIGTEDQALHNETEIKVWIFVEDEGEVAADTWVYNPELELVSVKRASEVGYTPRDYAQSTTPVLKIRNTGHGPMRLQEIVALDIEQPVPIAGSGVDKTGFARALIAREPGQDGLEPVETHGEGGFFIPEGYSAYYALDGYFTHSGPDPEQLDSVEQTFDVELRWIFNRARFEVVAQLQGGITDAGRNAEYQFREFEISNVDEASPLSQ